MLTRPARDMAANVAANMATNMAANMPTGFVADTGEVEVLMQLRAAWTHEGGTWGLPGGARDSHEAVEQAAVREAWEETGVPPGAVDVVASVVSTDHGDWCYTVVIGRARAAVDARPANAESEQVRWVALSRVEDLALHPGLAASWTGLLSEVLDLRW
jgi:8-oxo-dGTP diphosphatase